MNSIKIDQLRDHSNSLISRLVDDSITPARAYLLEHLKEGGLYDVISQFGTYTIEGLIVHEMGHIFTQPKGDLIVRLPALIERIDSKIYFYTSIMRQEDPDSPLNSKELKQSLLEIRIRRVPSLESVAS